MALYDTIKYAVTAVDCDCAFTERRYRYASAVYAVVVSVRLYGLSVTCRYCIKTPKRRITQTTKYDNEGTLLFCAKDLGGIPTQ